MNHVSIFEKKWLDLVFEGKNKSYGAYQLRLENPRTTLLALFFGLLLLTSSVGVSVIISKITGKAPTVFTNPLDEVIQVDLYTPQDPKPPQTQTAPVFKEPENNDETQLHDPVVVRPDEANPNIAPNTNNMPTTPNTPGTGIPGENPTPGTGTPTAPGTGVPEIPTGVITNTALLDRLPEYPEGIDKFYKYISRNFEKPEINDVKTVRVFVNFVIEKDGTMTDIKVTRDPGYGLAKEAIRVLKSLKVKWSPGMIKGQPVRTSYSLPITVNME